MHARQYNDAMRNVLGGGRRVLCVCVRVFVQSVGSGGRIDEGRRVTTNSRARSGAKTT